MKKINHKFFLVAASACMLMVSGCSKKFDTDSYKPKLDINGYSAADEISSSQLVGYWSFNDNLNDQVSGAVGENVGVSTGEGIKGKSLQGSLNSYLISDPSSAISGLESFTIAFWVNTPPPSTGIVGLVSLANTTNFWGNIDLFFENGSTNAAGKFRGHVYTNGSDFTVEVNDIANAFDKWIHMALTYDATTGNFKLYKDGGPIATVASPAGPGALDFANVGMLVFGCNQFMTHPSQTSATDAQGWASYLTGRMDEVRIYNKALSDLELSSLVLLEGRGK